LNLCLTHTVTHTRKNADGVNGRESAKDYDLPQQKGPESAEQRHSRGWQSVGKDGHGVKSCVSENRQSQGWRWENSAGSGLEPFLTARPGWQDGMHTLV